MRACAHSRGVHVAPWLAFGIAVMPEVVTRGHHHNRTGNVVSQRAFELPTGPGRRTGIAGMECLPSEGHIAIADPDAAMIAERPGRMARRIKHDLVALGSSPILAGRLSFGIFAALAEFESELIRERTIAGPRVARARGRKGGWKPALTKAQVRTIQAAMAHRDTPVSELCSELGISPVTLYRYVDPQGNLRDHGKRAIGAWNH